MLWGEILIRREGAKFSLRHRADREASAPGLRIVSIGGLRELSNENESGEFRPLKASPDLKQGWLCWCLNEGELGEALNHLYPGSIPDWFSARSEAPPVTDFRPFSSRQSGMYRITTFLSDAQAGEVIQATCHPRFCLKQRLWSVEGLSPDSAATKSVIPCLEPCAIFLEMARKAVRIEQEPKTDVQLSTSELASVLSAVESLLEQGKSTGRMADLGSPSNPRRLQLLLEKHRKKQDSSKKKEIE